MNTIFEVAHSAGMRTAWIDKHPSYEMVSGPSGTGVDDLFTPEIGSAARDVKGQEAYDDVKVDAVLNEIGGKDHAGKPAEGVPALFGMAFQEFRFAHSALKSRGLLDSTLIIITAKHGQAPMDRSKHRLVDDTIIPNMVNRIQNGLVALSYADGNITSLWLTDQSQTQKVAETLNQPSNQAAAGIEKVLWGESLKLMIKDPSQDTRVPDIVVIPNFGTSYAPADEQGIAAHGGFSDDDTHVALLLSNPGLSPRIIRTPVQTMQVAPTILQALGIDPGSLQAVQQEKTTILPGLFAGPRSLLRLLSSE